MCLWIFADSWDSFPPMGFPCPESIMIMRAFVLSSSILFCCVWLYLTIYNLFAIYLWYLKAFSFQIIILIIEENMKSRTPLCTDVLVSSRLSSSAWSSWELSPSVLNVQGCFWVGMTLTLELRINNKAFKLLDHP